MAQDSPVASVWMDKAQRLLALDEGEGEPAENLGEALRLLQQLHGEDVSDGFREELWRAAQGWQRLRQTEAMLRAVANEQLAVLHWQDRGACPSSELLRPPYVPELLSEVSTAMAAVVQEHPGRMDARSGTGKADMEAEKYVCEKVDDGCINLFMDSRGNLETMMHGSKTSEEVIAPSAKSPADWVCTEALCKVACNETMCNHPRGLCWHCWRREDTQEQHPEEFRHLLSYARSVAETAAPLQRASEIALRWPFLEDVAAATLERLRDVQPGAGVLVLGGVGVAAVRAAKDCGAKVIVWEPRAFVATTIRAIVAANDLGNGSIDVVDGNTQALEVALLSAGIQFSLIVVEGLEIDGLLGFGVLKQLQAARAILKKLFQSAGPRVLPSSLQISVRLADARVAEVSKFDFTAFARVSKAFAPFLASCGTNATSSKPKLLTEEREAFTIDLEAALVEPRVAGSNIIWDWPDADIDQTSLELRVLPEVEESSVASAVLVSFTGSFGVQSSAKKWGESVFYIPPVQISSDVTKVSCFRNSTKIWFEAASDGQALSSGMPLYGPPFGHAFLQEWYLDMYRDLDRNDFYEEGLRRWVQKHKKEVGDEETTRVMDIGSGTGLLLFFGLRAGADEVVGVEVAPNLKRMSEALYATNVRIGRLPGNNDFKIIHNDALCLELPEDKRPHCLVTEMMDGSGFGENMVRVILHAKAKLLAQGAEGEIVPRRLVIKAVLLNMRLPRIAGVDLSPFEAYWGPTRALGAESEFANIDLDNPEAGECDVVSEVVEVWSVDFSKSAADIAEALRSYVVSFPLKGSEECTVNSVAWWFEAHLDDSCDAGAPPPPILTNVPVFLREGPTGGGTHWHQAVSAVGPFRMQPGSAVPLKAYTDGKKLTWTSAQQVTVSEAVARADALREPWKDFARKAEEEAQLGIWLKQRMAQDVGDAPRLAGVRAAAMHVGCQPGLFGVFGGASVASHVLKEWFGAGCSA